MVPETPNPFGCLPQIFTILMAGIMMFFVGTTQTVTPPQSAAPDEPTFQSMSVIESVNPIILESMPVQIKLEVQGYHADGCIYPAVVEQTRQGNRVNIKIYREMPIAVICPMSLNPYQDTIMLDGTFESGTYTIDVNGTVIEVTV
ncbi:MAG: hypothetical protein J0L63_08275 [Anaerolineae bacterium]|nr:hypothetical protein [Anaerolineae bacterium]MBN8618887.1 hypothetical protein [Anaerolineae bacterium]